MSKSSQEYWLTYDGEDVASKLMQHHTRYFGTQFNPIWQMWQRNTYAYYSTILDSQAWFSALQFVGAQGELVKMSVPQARSLIRNLLTLITKSKLAFNATAQVENTAVTEEVRIANALSEQVVKEQSLDSKNTDMVENGLVLGTGFMKTTWRTDKGHPVAVKDESQVIYEGDLEITVPHIMDMLYNFAIPNWDDLEWVECRVKRSRWTLIAQHPELTTQILKLPSCSAELSSRSYQGFEDNDMVYVYEVYCRPTPALPKGRMVVYSDPKTIFFDDENPYGTIPIEQYKPEPIQGLGFGYPKLADLLPSQEMYDHEFSCIATNHSGLGVQNVAMPRGSDINVQEIMGMNCLWYTPQNVPGGGKPEPLRLVADAPETFRFAEMIVQNMQQMSNMNKALLGDVGQGTSGTAIATLTTNALEFLSSYAMCDQLVLEKTMMHAINAYRRFAKTERLVTITGKNYQSFSKKFNAKDDLAPIKAIHMQAVNPMMQTIAGRVDIADKVMQKGLITNIQEYVSILDGSPLSQLYETDLAQNDLIHGENERLQTGQEVRALSIDNHPLHILKHKCLLDDPIIRLNSELAGKILGHIEEHNQLQKTTDPMLMAMANTGKVPELPPPVMMPGGPTPGPAPMSRGAPPPSSAPPPSGKAGSEAMAPGEPQGPSHLQGPAKPQAPATLPTGEPAHVANDLLGRRR